MAGGIFQAIYHTNPSKFKSTNAVNDFVSKKINMDLPVQRIETNLVVGRGNVFKYLKINTNKAIDNIIKKIK